MPTPTKPMQLLVPHNPQDPPEVHTPKTTKKTLADPKSDIQLTVNKPLLQGADHTFILHLQHTGNTVVPLDNYRLELTLQEKGGKSTMLAYTDANNQPQTIASIQQKLNHFTNKKELSPTDPAFDIPITLQTGPDVKEVTITINLISPDNTQTSIVVWQILDTIKLQIIQAAQKAGAGNDFLTHAS